MAKKWSEVSNSPDFLALNETEQENARNQYFEQVVAPNVPEADKASVRSRFDADTKISKPSRKEQISAKINQPRQSNRFLQELSESSPAAFRFLSSARAGADALAQVAHKVLPESAIKSAQGVRESIYDATGGYLGSKTPKLEDIQAHKQVAATLDDDGGVDWAGLGGAVADPVTLVAGGGAYKLGAPLVAGASKYAPAVISRFTPNALAKLTPTALATSAAFMTQPVKDMDNFWSEKAGQGATGLGVGYTMAYGLDKAAAGGAALYAKIKKMGAGPEDIQKAVAASPEKFQAIQNNVIVDLKQSGINFDELLPAVKDKVNDYVAKAMTLGADPTDAAQVARQAILEANPIPMKGLKGQLSQDVIDQQTERMAADSIFGGAIKDKLKSDPVNLIANMDAIHKKMGREITSESDFGRSLRDFVTGKYSAKKEATSALYKEAKETAGGLPVTVGDDIIEFFRINKGFPGVGGLLEKAKALGIVSQDDTGKLIAETSDFRRLAELRSSASALTKGGGSESAYGGQLKTSLDDIFEKQGGELYRAAVKSRREQGLTFESGPRVISKSLKMGTETDPAIDTEDLFRKLIVNGSIDDVKNLYTFAMKNKAPEQVEAVRSMTAQYLKDSAVVADSTGVSVSWPKLESAIKKMGGKEKLVTIYGKKHAGEIINLIESAKILNKQQPFAAGGSQTASRAVMLGSKLMNLLPYGEAGKEAGKAVYSAAQAGAAMNPTIKLAPKANLQPLNKLSQGNLGKSAKAATRNALAAMNAERE